MSRCLITGMETNNKWKGLSICKEMIEAAKDAEKEKEFKNMTMRQRLIKLQKMWHQDNERVKKEHSEAQNDAI